MKRWCPLAQGVCEDGHAKESEYPCVYWDSIIKECAVVAAAFLQVEKLREVDDEYLSKLGGDDANL